MADARAAHLCRHCGEPVDHLPRGWRTGDPEYCSRHHALFDRDPVCIGIDALDHAQWLHDLGSADLVHWPWRSVNDLVGPLVPGRLTYTAAFPGAGKTTFLMACLDAWLRAGKRVLFLPLESHPGEVFTRLACLELGLSADVVLSKRLRMRADAGDVAAKADLERLTAAFDAMKIDRRLMEQLRIEPIDALTTSTFLKAMQVAEAAEVDLVMIDHVDHIEAADGKSSGIAVSDALQKQALRAARKLQIPFVLATQLNSSRTGGDRFAHYKPPLIDWLFNKGSKEQVAASILGLSRVLSPNVDAATLKSVQRGQRDIASIAQTDRMAVSVLKSRYGGASRDRTIHLAYRHGVLSDLDSPDIFDISAARHGIGTGSPSQRWGTR